MRCNMSAVRQELGQTEEVAATSPVTSKQVLRAKILTPVL